ncbi:class I SAM-dependent methyltransferase [Heliophilum fasciatum]|uniref:SAM-dependent MidA family methyltransferase n=1 Tax=Heliophilum fasciatum TaxID=35700 RepID=A0A4R2RSK5_9FIRM|nr:SAM-dependent methyltransferase [Heliophilum fasciatum]TCP67252.1 SAM-dependent MidA family methyltransferase [Heliophilum fasciatum]
MDQSPLTAIVAAQIRENGALPFHDFMEQALYHPQYGYYTTSTNPIGLQGDFFTSPEVGPVFGELLARQIHDFWQQAGQPPVFHVIECGPGRGSLAASLLMGIDAFPQLAQAVIYHLIEISPRLRQVQQSTLASVSNFRAYESAQTAIGGTYGWSTLEELPGRLTGCVLTNEFFDALPCHRLILHEGQLAELYVTDQESPPGFAWQRGPLSRPDLADWYQKHLVAQHVQLEEGQIAEIHPAMEDYLHAFDRILAQGFILTIDYGHPATLLYGASHYQGTLMCYHRHRADSDPLTSLGQKDITAHIDFTALQTLGHALGWQNLGLTNQMWLLINLLEPADMAVKPDMNLDDFNRHQTLKKIIAPGGMGETFRVLIQSKGLAPAQLKGLTIMPR